MKQASEVKEAVKKALNNTKIQGFIDSLIAEGVEITEPLQQIIKSTITKSLPELKIHDIQSTLDKRNGIILINFYLEGDVLPPTPEQLMLIYDTGDYSGNFQYHN
ncbi:MAG: hypothetical protein AAFV71_32430 [Cyanobacteria bacterium J06633_8]